MGQGLPHPDCSGWGGVLPFRGAEALVPEKEGLEAPPVEEAAIQQKRMQIRGTGPSAATWKLVAATWKQQSSRYSGVEEGFPEEVT